MYPTYTFSERILDACVHVAGVLAGLTGLVALLIAAAPSLHPVSTASVAVYGTAMVVMFSCSAAYHLVPMPDWKDRLRRLDQAAIFLKIAGTYTPFAIVSLGGAVGWVFLSAVWVVGLLGATAKLVLAARWEKMTVGLYLALGWAGIIIAQPLLEALSTSALVLLVAGGALYTFGVVFHLWHSLRFHNAIWHLFVLAGTACHFAAVVIAVFE